MPLAVLIPARDEAPRLAGTLAALRAAVPDAVALVVDDHSQDETAEVARQAGAEVLPAEGRGYAEALALGMRRLAERGFDVVVLLDADGQHPPADVPRLVSALEHADLVVGSRQGTRSPGSLGRRLGNAALSVGVAALGARAADGAWLRDVTSGFQAYGPAALAALARDFPADVADANLRLLAARRGLRLAEVPVSMPARSNGRSMHDGPRAILHLGVSAVALLRAAGLSLPLPSGRRAST